MMLEKMVASLLCGFSRLVTGARTIWFECEPVRRQRVYFANHRSHGDFLLVWAALRGELRQITRPVAGSDYWLSGKLKTYLITKVFRAVLVDRHSTDPQNRPLQTLLTALAAHDSLIIFPEGTRNMGEDLLPFKSGIFHMAHAFPQLEFVPVWIENLGRVMPKGSYVPVPLLCSVTFGCALTLNTNESKEQFIERARSALLALAPLPG